jgi:Sulfotransferase family
VARDPLLLVHLPKTAGTTLAQLMRYHYSGGGFMGAGNVFRRFDEVEDRLERIARKPTIRASSGHVSFGMAERVLPDATFVTILRDPVARTLSQYFFLAEAGRGGGLVPPGLPEETRGLSLEAAFDRGYLLDDLQTRMLCGLLSPYDELPADALDRAKTNLSDRFAYVGTTERFDELLAVLNLALGWSTTAHEPARENPRRPAEVTDELRALAAERNRLDRELHTFAGQLFAERVDAAVEDEAAVIGAATAEWNRTDAGHEPVASPLRERVERALQEATLVRAAFEERNRRAKVKRARKR